jgi:cytochrome c oxidase subunit III
MGTTTADHSTHGATHGHDHGHADAGPAHPREVDIFGRATHGKIGMWIYLCTDAMTFAGFLLGYALLRGRTPNWPVPANVLGLELSSIMTFILILSSVTMVIAQAKGEARNRKGLITYLAITAFGGLCFLGMQAYEYTHLIHSGMTLAHVNMVDAQGVPLDIAPQFAQTFFIVTSFHGLHVLSGVIYLLIILGRAIAGKFDNGDVNHVEVCGLFWHFVDLVWILVFTFMYLI